MLDLLTRLIGNTRNMIALGVVSSVNDSGAAQTVNVTTGDGVSRANVEVLLPFGFSAMPPLDGAICLVFSLGADPANMMALPISNPSGRLGGLLDGEAALYGGDGSRVHIRQGGIVDIWGGAEVNVHTKACTINAPSGSTINGDVTVNGDLTTTGNLADSHGTLDRLRGHYNGHTHPGGGTTSEPDPE